MATQNQTEEKPKTRYELIAELERITPEEAEKRDKDRIAAMTKDRERRAAISTAAEAAPAAPKRPAAPAVKNPDE